MNDDVIERVARAMRQNAISVEKDANIDWDEIGNVARDAYRSDAKAALAALQNGDFVGDLVLVSGPDIARIERMAAEEMWEACLAEVECSSGPTGMAAAATAIRALKSTCCWRLNWLVRAGALPLNSRL